MIFVALGDGEQALSQEGGSITFNLAGLSGVKHTGGGLFGEAMTGPTPGAATRRRPK
jgi:hypothetical protein